MCGGRPPIRRTTGPVVLTIRVLAHRSPLLCLLCLGCHASLCVLDIYEIKPCGAAARGFLKSKFPSPSIQYGTVQ